MSWRRISPNPFAPRRGQTYRNWVLSCQRSRYVLWVYCAPCRG
jgi:hypothetical protein